MRLANGLCGLEEDTASADDDPVWSDKKYGIPGDFGGGAGDVGVFMLEINFGDAFGGDAELGEARWGAKDAVLAAKLIDRYGAHEDIVDGYVLPAPAHGFRRVDEVRTDLGAGLCG